MDDDEPICRLAASMLEHLGYSATTCTNGEEAIGLYKSAKDSARPYLTVIMDLVVNGGMGGKDAAEQILLEDPHARLIVSSGNCDDPVMTDHSRYGFQGLLPKPYSIMGMAEVLNALLPDFTGVDPGTVTTPSSECISSSPVFEVPTAGEYLAQKLLATGKILSCDDYCKVAVHLQCESSKESILAMRELERWPAAHAWLKDKLR